jgi:hypothetical protein
MLVLTLTRFENGFSLTMKVDLIVDGLVGHGFINAADALDTSSSDFARGSPSPSSFGVSNRAPMSCYKVHNHRSEHYHG